MARHNPKEPKFRCNFCKEYHFVPEHKTMYQCPVHGYLCEKYIVTESTKAVLHFVDYSLKKSSTVDKKEVNFPRNYLNFCNIDGAWSFTRVRDEFKFEIKDLNKNNLSIKSNDIDLIDYIWNKKYYGGKTEADTYGCKKTLKYIWSDEMKIWIEDSPQALTNKKNNNTESTMTTSNKSEIKLLLDLFEKNIITKDQFLEQMNDKLR